jgi:hypothetical protein
VRGDPITFVVANALSTTGTATRLRGGVLDDSTTAALNAAAPIYLARLWASQLPPTVLSAFERHWLPYLDGKTSFEQALSALVRDAR